MKTFLEKCFGLSVALILIVAVIFGLSTFLQKIPKYEELITVEGQLEDVELRQTRSRKFLSRNRAYYYLYINTDETTEVVKIQQKYIEHIVSELELGEHITTRVMKDDLLRDILWVWEIEQSGVLLLPFEDMRDPRIASEQRFTMISQILGGVCLVSLLICGLTLSFVYKTDCKTLFYIAIHRTSEKNPTEHAAKQILDASELLYVEEYEYQIADAKEFTHLDLKFYDETLELLEKKRFRHLADEENVTVNSAKSAGMRTFIRVALSHHGVIVAGIFHWRSKQFWLRWLSMLSTRKHGKVLEFQTEFSNGVFMTTSTAQSSGNLEQPPQVISEFYAYDTPHEQVLERHTQRLVEYLKTNPVVKPLAFRNIEDVTRSDQRLTKIRAQFRKKRGGLTKGELHRLSNGNADDVESVSKEIESIQQRPMEDGSDKPFATIEDRARKMFSKRLEGDKLSTIVTVLGAALATFPALSLAGFWFDFLAKLPLEAIAGLSILGSLLFFCLIYPERRYWYMGIASGLFTGPLVAITTYYYAVWRESLWKLEIFIPVLVGSIPGLLLWYFPLRKVVVRRIKQELEKAQEKQDVEKSQKPGVSAPTATKTRKPTISEKQYSVIFYGKIAPGHQLDDVKKHIATLYKVPVAKCEHLFTGKRYPVRRNIDYPTAQKYKTAFEKTGAICHIEESVT